MYARDIAIIATPLGSVRLESDDHALTAIRIEAEPVVSIVAASALLRDAADQIAAWLAGERTNFDLRLTPASTARGQALREAMLAIPYGDTESYGAFARRAGSSPRAIGQVCARNPFPIVVPCHRVLASNGLGHYSGGRGVMTKQWLLAHEQRHRRTA